MIGTCTALLIVLAAGPSPDPLAPDPNALAITVRVDGFLARGALDRDFVTLLASAQAYGETLGFFIQPEVRWGRVNTVETDRELYLRALGYYKPRALAHGHVLAIPERSLRRSQEYRLIAGVGVGLNVLREPNRRLLFSATLIEDWIQFSTDGYEGARTGTTPNVRVTRVGLRTFGQFAPTTFLRISFDLILVPALDLLEDTRIISSASIAIPITNALSFTTSADFNYDALVALGGTSEDFSVRFGLQVRLPVAKPAR